MESAPLDHISGQHTKSNANLISLAETKARLTKREIDNMSLRAQLARRFHAPFLDPDYRLDQVTDPPPWLNAKASRTARDLGRVNGKSGENPLLPLVY